jgi:hypothetical protein
MFASLFFTAKDAKNAKGAKEKQKRNWLFLAIFAFFAPLAVNLLFESPYCCHDH